MKKILTAVAMALLLLGCVKQEDDHSAILEKLAELDNRVSALEGSIASIQSAIGDGVFAQKVEPYVDTETGKTIGVTVTYTSGKVVYFEISPKAGYAGPVLGVITNGAGQLVWAVDGVAIKDNKGNEVPVNKTPVFTIDEDGYLLVSIDGGDPVVVGKVQNEGATLVDGIFKDIRVEQDKVVLVLSDDSIVNIPFATAFKLNIEQKEYILENNNTITIPYTVSGKTENTVVGVAGYDPYFFYVEVTEENIQITPLNSDAEGVLLVYADSQVGLTSIVTVSLSREAAHILDPEDSEYDVDYLVESEGGNLEMHVISNVDIDVKVDAETTWMSIVGTKANHYTITVKVDENKGDEDRFGYVSIYKKGTEKRLQWVEVYQKKSSVDNAKDLSQLESANSYIVTEAGQYKFKAVKGNSAVSVGDVEKVEILWETENTATAPEVNAIIAKVKYTADGYVRFETPETLKPGNALIAVRDIEGKILWSWHIWVPAEAIVIWDSEDFAGAKMMDRNLGALKATGATGDVDPLSIGMYYQWGRKDPFPGSVEFAKTPKGAAVAGQAWTYHQELITTEYSIQHPTEYASVPEKDAGVWNSEDPKDLWNTDGNLKTIYDPCPPGYRVPIYDSSKPMWKGSWTGFTTEGSRISYGDFHFTIAGYIDCYGASYYYSNLRTHIWASKWYDAERGTAMYIRTDKDDSEKYYSQKYHKAKAGSVRCVVDPNAPVPDNTIDLSENGTANSYIVGEAGDYKFKAVKGNSTESVGTIDKVELVWETNNTATAPEAANTIIAEVGLKDDYVTFSTPETLVPGNALIAAKDAEGKILWSWHIWIPKTEVTVDAFGDAMGGVKVMDRNLGALVVAEASETDKVDVLSFGLFYQWGRKDPFPGMANGDKKPMALVGTQMTKQNPGITMAESIANPTVYTYTPQEGKSEGFNWCSEEIPEAWGASGAKAIYDPCPVGYRVPVKGDWCKAGSQWTFKKANWWFKLGDAVFPYAGYMDDNGGSYAKVGERNVFWTATNESLTNGKGAYIKDEAFNGDSARTARGSSVRCVADVVAN